MTTTDMTIQYAPDTWNASQLAAHRADTMEEALLRATCLAGGWYRRAVTIDYQVTESNDERYMIRPADIAPQEGWRPCYTVSAHV